MGLDIYLYEAEQARINREYNTASEALYEPGPDGKSPRDKMSDDEYKAWSAQYSYTSVTHTPSEKYPSHLFDRRYLRSSYNGGGFDHAVPEMLGSADGSYPTERGSLSWIFAPVRLEDQYDVEMTAASITALKEAKARALQVAGELRNCDRLRVLTVSPNMFSKPPQHTDDDALRMYRRHVAEKAEEPTGWYSVGEIEVFGGGLPIVAAIAGTATFGIPGVHLIYRAADEGFDSYIQSAEIVAEFCDEAITLIERDGSCEMSWSG